MAQMAPALTEANASPGSPRKNSVDRYCSSTVPEDLKQNAISKGVDLTLLSRNGLVRLLDDSDSSNNITNTTGEQSSCLSSPPKSSIRNEEQFTKEDMPNGHCVSHKENDVDMTKSAVLTSDSQKRKPAIPTDLSRRACASSPATTLAPTGACNIELDGEKNNRLLKHPVASFDSSMTNISQRTVRSVQRQTRLENRAKRLEKRLRRLQTRQIETHVHRQLKGIVDQVNEKSESFGSSTGEEKVFSERVDKKPNVNTVKEGILSVCALRSHETDNDPINYQAKDPRNASSPSNPAEIQLENVVKYSPESVNKAIRNALTGERQKFETESLVEGLTAYVEHLETMYDSDATEASSGDESEEETIPEMVRSNVSKSLRKAYQIELGEISSRWSWLQSQIINLERQIRRYEDLHKNVRVSKQPVKLQAQATVSELDIKLAPPANGISTTKIGTSLTDATELKLNLFKEPQNHLRNGLKKTILHNSVIEEKDIPSKRLCTSGIKNDIADNKHSGTHHGSDFISHSARTRGIYPIRNRLLVCLSSLKEFCKFKETSCQCSTPETPCISCTKVAKTITVVDPALPVAERVKLLDQSYHPVLSFPTDIPLQFHFASILKKGGFESRTKPQTPKTSTQSERKKQAVSKSSNRRAQLAKGAAASLLSSAKFRNQRYERKRGYTSLPSTPKNNIKTEQTRSCHTDIPRKKRAAAISAAAQLQKRARSLSLPTTGSSSSTPTSSPSPTLLSNSMPQATLGLLLRKKRTNNAFDINNIVIPYSMASSTRVEKLQYKEIPTPNWRVLEIATHASGEEHPEEKTETENLDDEVIIERHEICEELERKRFLGFLTKKRKRSQRQSSELGSTEDTQNTPPGTPGMMPSPTGLAGSGSITPTGGSLFSRSLSMDQKLSHRRTSSTDSLLKTTDVESWPTVAPFPLRSFPLTDEGVDNLKLPTPLPTPVPSLPASPNPMSPSSLSLLGSPLASPASDIDVNDKTENEKNEWTVKLVTSDNESTNGDPNQPRKGIVLKLAKR